MKDMITLRVKNKYAQQYQEGFPLLFPEAVLSTRALKKEGMLFRLLDEKNRFIGQGYYGKQNKGIGWILSNKEHEAIDYDFFQKRIASALQRRASLFQSHQTTAFRVFNGEGDGIGGLLIDYYDNYYMIQWYSKGVYQFRDEVVNAIKTLTPCKGIYQKKRFDDDGKYIEEDDFILGSRPDFPLVIKENGMKFATYLNDGAMTGIFLDQREVRQALRSRYAKGKTVLNTFSYTGAFSVAAAYGGASSITSVDVANRSLEKTQEQFAINDLKVDHKILVEDVFDYFRKAKDHGTSYDVVILDPPSFAKTKKRTFSVAKDYESLLMEAIDITSQDGLIVASTNAANLSMERFENMVENAFKRKRHRYKILDVYRLPKDFRVHYKYHEGNYLKVLFIHKKS